MGIASFFAAAASSLRDRYWSLAEGIDSNDSSPLNPRRGFIPSEPRQVTTDRYEPSGNSPVTDNTEATALPATKDQPPAEPTPQDESSPSLRPDGTYYFMRRARLDYRMQLQFDLAAFTRSVQQAADGNAEAVEEFAAAGFGLTAALDFKGREVVQTNMTENSGTEGGTTPTVWQTARGRQAAAFGYQSRNFAVESFRREAVNIRRASKVTDFDGHRRTVNKFSLRFMLDNSFSFAFLDRFNIQTRDVAEQVPESLSSYLASAGNMAESGTSEMMAAFFDAVDGYLDEAEVTLADNVGRFFDLAAEALGFSGEMVDSAKVQLTETVASFFDQVETALASLQSRFLPPEAELPPGSGVPRDYLDPAVAQEQAQLTVA